MENETILSIKKRTVNWDLYYILWCNQVLIR